MRGYLKEIVLPNVRAWSEDLYEQEFYVDRPWMEIRDEENFHDTILHFFLPKGKYMQSVNGNIRNGQWNFMESANKLVINIGKGASLYDLAYLDRNFFILQKHGNNYFFVMGYEPVVKNLQWRDAMELLFNQHRQNSSNFTLIAVVAIVIIGILIALSVF